MGKIAEAWSGNLPQSRRMFSRRTTASVEFLILTQGFTRDSMVRAHFWLLEIIESNRKILFTSNCSWGFTFLSFRIYIFTSSCPNIQRRQCPFSSVHYDSLGLYISLDSELVLCFNQCLGRRNYLNRNTNVW